LNIKIPNLIISFPLLAAPEHVLDGGCFIDTQQDSGNVQEEKHKDGHKQNYGEIEVIPVLIFSPLRFYSSCIIKVIVSHYKGKTPSHHARHCIGFCTNL
jgi:hypothetical protein